MREIGSAKRWWWTIPFFLCAALAAHRGDPRERAEDGATLDKPIAPQATVMYWHDRAFGQMNLGLARKDQKKAARNAWLLAELANINSRHNDSPRFKAFAAQLRKHAVEVANAVEQENVAMARASSKKISQTCKACHHQFRHDEDENGEKPGP